MFCPSRKTLNPEKVTKIYRRFAAVMKVSVLPKIFAIITKEITNMMHTYVKFFAMRQQRQVTEISQVMATLIMWHLT